MAGAIASYPRSKSTWVLFLLASLHLSAELGHFLIGVVSKYVARDIHYGTKACFVNRNILSGTGEGGQNFNVSECIAAGNETICATVTGQDGSSACHWDWTGLGGEYQFLAGPSFMAIFTIASILWGILADKYDRVYILFSSSLLFSLALVFTAVSTKFWHLVVFRMMLAVGVAGVAPIAPGIIFDMFDSSERAMAMGFFHWGIYLGNGLTFVVGKYITEANLFNASWRSTFVLTGMPGALLAILVLFTVDDPPKSNRNERQITKNSSSKIKRGSAYHHHGLETESPEDDAETEATEDSCESIDEAQVLISSGGGCQNKAVSSKTAGALSCCLQPAAILLGLGACLRHSAGYTWGYNSALYFQTYFPNYSSASIWLTWITIGGGSLGVIFGGYVSDRLVSRLGIPSRALVLAGSQIIATPFALGLLYLKPPFAFISLFIGYLFAEMWYGVVFAILVELLPASFRSLGLAISLFVVNNVGGNLPIIVTPLTTMFGFRGALTILYPGALFMSTNGLIMKFLSHPIVSVVVIGLSLGTLVQSDPSCIDNTKLKYEVGKSYVYDVKLVSNIGTHGELDIAKLKYQPQDNINGNIKTTGKAVLTALENCQYALTLNDGMMSTERFMQTGGSRGGRSIPRTSILFTFKNGEISSLYRNESSQPWTTNILRGILIMIQNKGLTNADGNPMDNELNIMGECKVHVYVPKEGKYTKKIYMEQCSESANSPVISEGVRYETPLYSDKVGPRFPHSVMKCTTILENDVVSSVSCTEVDDLPVIHPLLESNSQLTLEKSNMDPTEVNGASTDEIAQLTTRTSRFYDFSHNIPDSSWEESLVAEIITMANSMHGDHDANKAELYLQLKEKLRLVTNFQPLDKKLIESANGDVLRTQFLLNIVRDIGSEIGTEASVVHLSKLILKKGLSEGTTTIFYLKLSFSRDPSVKGLKALGKIADSLYENFNSFLTTLVVNFGEKKRLRNFILGATGYAHQFCKRSNPKCASVPEYVDLVDTIAKFTSSKLMEIAPAALHALGNVDYLPPASVKVIKDILTHDEILGATKKITAFEAFRRDPCQPELKTASRTIFENVELALELRIEAYLALTRCITKEDSRAIDRVLSNPTSKLSAFIASHIYNVMDSQSPSKQFMKDTLLGQIGIPGSVPSVHRQPRENKYFERSTFDPIANLGFSVDGHVFYQNGIEAPSFLRFNTTLDVRGKSYNFLEVGASSRLVPSAIPILMSRREMGWKSQMMPLFFGVDSYYRIFGTTVSMGIDVIDMFKPHEFIDQSQNEETGLWRFDFVHPFTLMEHEVEFPTLTGIPLTLTSEAAYFPMVTMNHTGDPKGLGIWDVLNKWEEVMGTFTHHSRSDSAVAVKGQVSLGKGTPVQIGMKGEGKLHFNHSIGYTSLKPTAKQWIKKIEFPDQVIWSKRLTVERKYSMEVDGKLVESWNADADRLPQQIGPNELYKFEALGLRVKGTVLNKPTPINGGPYDVIFAVEKTEEEFTGYNMDITTETPEDFRKVFDINLKANGLSSKDKIHANIDLTDVGIQELFNNDDKPKTTMILHADMSQGGNSHGLKLDYKSVGPPKSDINLKSPLGEKATPGVLALTTAYLVTRPSYHLKLQISNNEKKQDLLDWKISNGKEDADMTMKFNGSLKPSLGLIKGHLSIPLPTETDQPFNEVESESHGHHHHHHRHIPKLNAKLSLDSKNHGSNKLAVDFASNKNEITLDTTTNINGDTYTLKQVIPKSLHTEETEGSVSKSSRERRLKAEYSDSKQNKVSIDAAYSSKTNHDMSLDSTLYVLRNMSIHLVKNGKEKPFIAEGIIMHDQIQKGDHIEKRKLATFYVDNFGNKQAEVTVDRNYTISGGDGKHSCNGVVVPWRESDGNFGLKCKTVTAVAEAVVKDQFEVVSKFSNADPAVTTFDIAGFHTKSEISANLSTTVTKEKEGKVMHKTSKFFMHKPHTMEQYTQDSETVVDVEARTLKSTSTLVRTNTQDATTQSYVTNLDGSLPRDIFNGESKLSMKYNGAGGEVLNVDIANNAQSDKTRFNNNLTTLIDHHGRTKIASPKKQLTWAFTSIKDEIPEESRSKYHGSHQFISDLKFEELTQPEALELVHYHDQFNVFKLVGKESWTGNGEGLLRIGGKEKMGFNHAGTFDITMEEAAASAQQGELVKFVPTHQRSGKTKLNFVLNGWLSQEMPELRNHTLYESYALEFAPKELELIEDVHVIYKKVDTQTGNVMSLVDVNGHKDFIFHNWMDISLKENYTTQIDQKTYSHEKDIKVSGPHISVYVKNDDQDEGKFLVDFAAGAYEERHQDKFNMRSRSSSKKGFIPTTNFNMTISRRR
ncbi:unnamed protein product [Orchesella dallaii]|uniref:Major facilitator superfamily (MFS) profile domain-containing protein n=1 Tax=Orchesella dallaii TaxID=48710 RepID=A0ABP1Q719_9HEXA